MLFGILTNAGTWDLVLVARASATISTYNYLPAGRGFLVEGSLGTSWDRAARVRDSQVCTSATDFQSDLGRTLPEFCICLYPATGKSHRGDQVYSEGTPLMELQSVS